LAIGTGLFVAGNSASTNAALTLAEIQEDGKTCSKSPAENAPRCGVYEQFNSQSASYSTAVITSFIAAGAITAGSLAMQSTKSSGYHRHDRQRRHRQVPMVTCAGGAGRASLGILRLRRVARRRTSGGSAPALPPSAGVVHAENLGARGRAETEHNKHARCRVIYLRPPRPLLRTLARLLRSDPTAFPTAW
jgi:hypothetical protein